MSVVVLGSTRPEVRGIWTSRPDKETWTYLGWNSGNILWKFASERVALVADSNATLIPGGVDLLGDPSFSSVLLNARAVVYPTANLLMHHEDPNAKKGQVLGEIGYIKSLAIALRPVPVILCGIGYEGSAASTDVVLGSDAVDMLETVAQHGIIICRGRTTGDIIARHGIPDNKIFPLGCPSSVLWRRSISHIPAYPCIGTKLGVALPKISAKHLSVAYPSVATALMTLLTSSSSIGDVIVIAQDRYDFELCERLSIPTVLYTSISEWCQCISESVQVILSFRIHGTIAALTAGVPVVFVPTCCRTLELSKCVSGICTLRPDDPSLLDVIRSKASLLQAALYARSCTVVEHSNGNPQNPFSDAISHTALGLHSSVIRPWSGFSFDIYRSLCSRAECHTDFGAWYDYANIGHLSLPYIHAEEEAFAKTFPGDEYRVAYPDLGGYGGHNAYLHFTRHGIGEGRKVPSLPEGWIAKVLRIISKNAAWQDSHIHS